MEDRVNTGKTASAPHDAAQRNAKRPLKAVSCVRTILALFMAVVMLATAVLTNWPQTSGLLDFLAKIDKTITDDMIPETVEAASPTNWAAGETWTLASFPSAEAIANVTGWDWYNDSYQNYAGAYNWNILRMVIESWGRPKDSGLSQNIPANTKPLTIYVNEVKDGATFDAIVRNPIIIKKNQKIRIIGITRQGVDAIRFTREANTNFGAFFRVEEGGELCLGEKLAFTGDVTRQWQGAPYTEWVTTNDETSVVDRNAAIGFGNIGVRFMVGGKGFYAKFSGGGTRLSQFQATSTSPAPNIGLYTSANSFNYELKGNGTSPAKLPLSTSSGPYYVLAFDSSVGIRPINFNDFTSEGPAVSRNMTQFKNLSFEEKRPFLWELKQTGNYYYLKNLSSGKILKSTGTTLETISTASSYSVTRPGRYEREDWALGSRDSDTFTGDAYFVKSLGTFTIDGAVFRDLVLPADGTAVKSDGSINKNLKGNNAAPIVIDGGSFFMRSGAITNNTIAYTPDESMLQSSGEHDQTDAKTKTRAEIEENAPNNSAAATGSAGALIIKNGATAEITGGTIGALSPVTEDEKKHFARDFAGNPALNDGNKGDAGAIIVTGENTTLTMKNENENRYPVITGNTGAHAGTISVTNGASFTLEGKTKIIGNYNYIGGAVTPVGTGRFTMNGGDIAANDTMRLGGGIMVQSDYVTLIKGEIRENTAWGAGGGIYVQGHFSPYAKTLHLKYPTNIYNNYATSSGIDIAPDRSVNVHKESTAKDKETFGLAYKETNDGYGTHQTNDRINVDRSGVGDIDNNKSGSGGGVWLCPAGNTYLGNDAHLVLKVGGNFAEVQGDDFMKDNGGDGGVLFGANATTFWNTDWRTDNPVANGDGWYDTMPGARSGGAFTTTGFSASNALKLHSDATVSNVPGELNIYGNISRRGGGIGANGTLLIATSEPDVSVIQGIMTLEKKFAGSAKQDILMTVSIENEELNEKVTLGTYHLSDNPETVAANNAGITEEEVVRYETGHKVTIGIPQFIPGSEAKQNGDKYGVQLYDYNGGRWLDNRYQIVLEETDVNGNPLTDSRLQVSGLTIGKEAPVAAGPRVTYKTLTFSQDATNVQKPEIEKYINNVVHHDVIAPDEVFEFEIMAKMADDAKRETASFVVSDTLQKELVFCDVNGNPVTPGVAGDFFKTVRDIYWVEASDHVGTGTGSVTQTTGGNMNTWPLVATKTITEEADGRQTLTVGFMPNRLKDNNNLPNKWVRIRFYARFRDNASYQKALTHARDQAAGGYTDVSEGTGAGARVYWRNVTENTPLVSVPAGQETHAGIENHAHLSIDYGNEVKVEIDSNTVTVKPEEPTIEKYVNDVVHADLSNFDEPFTYDIIAYVPPGATEVTITDKLIRELEFCGRGGMRVAFDAEHNKASNNFNNVIFNSAGNTGMFDIRTTNDHNGNGAGTVANNTGVKASFPATLDNNNITGDGRLVIEEVTESNGDVRQQLKLVLNETNASDVFAKIKNDKAHWIHFSFKARFRPEYYTEIANKLVSGDLSRNTVIGWDVITEDGTVENGATRKGASGAATVINYPSQNHAGERNQAIMDITVANAGTSTSKTIESNTVTVKPEMTSLSVTKDWNNTSLSDLYFTGDYVNDAEGAAFIRRFAESLTLHCENESFNNNGVIEEPLLGAGSDYEIDKIEHLNGTAGTDNDARHWVVTFRKKSNAQEKSPVKLTITTSNGVSNLQGGGRRISWNLKWENLPKITRGSWRVTETQLSGDGFELPVYSGTDTSGNALPYAAQNERIGNTHRNDETVRIDVEKVFVNHNAANGEFVYAVLFAKFKDENGNPVALALEQNTASASAEESALWNKYASAFSQVVTAPINNSGETRTGGNWLYLFDSTTPAYKWKGSWDKLPRYLNGDEANEITYEVKEAVYNNGSGASNFYTGSRFSYASYGNADANNNFTYHVRVNSGTEATQNGQITVQDVTLTNEKAVIEKYVNRAVHAELPAFNKEFEYDILAYVPEGASNAVITDTLPVSLEFIDNRGRTLYTYNEATRTRESTQNNSFVKNNVLYSAHGNGVGRYDLITENNHIGNGKTGSVTGVNTGTVRPYQVQYVGQGLQDGLGGGLRISADGSDKPQTLTFEVNSVNNTGVWNNGLAAGSRWIHLRFKVRIRPEYFDDVLSRLSLDTESWYGAEDESLGWAIVSAQDATQYGEQVNGDGWVKDGAKQNSGGAYLSYGDVHAGLGNYAGLKVSNQPEAKSNTVTVVPKTTEIVVEKYWRGIQTPDEIGYYNYESTNPLLSGNVPGESDANADRGNAFINALADSFLLSDDSVTQNSAFSDYFAGWTRQPAVREIAYTGTKYNNLSVRGNGVGVRKPWYVTWKNAAGETHPTVLVIITDPVKRDYLGSGSADTYRWKLVWTSLPENGTTYHVTESRLTAYGFDTPVHSSTNGNNQTGYATDGGNIKNTKLNAEKIRVDVQKEWVNITPGSSDNTTVTVRLAARKADGSTVLLTDDTFTKGNTGGSAFNVSDLTLTAANGWSGGWAELPKYYRNDDSQETNRLTYTVTEVSYKQDNVAQTAGTDFSFTVKDNATGKIIDTNGTKEEANITGANASTTSFSYTLTNERASVEKYVNQAVHAELGAFDKEFTYDVLAYIPAGTTTFTITDTLPVAFEFVDDHHQTLYTYNAASGTRTKNDSFRNNQTVSSVRSNNGAGYYDVFAENDHKGDGTGAVTGTGGGGTASFLAKNANHQGVVITSENGMADGAQTMTFTLARGKNDAALDAVLKDGYHWVHLRFNVRIRPEYYLAIASRLGKTASVWDSTTDPALGWAIVDKDGNVQTHRREMTDGDGAVVQGMMQSASGMYLSYGDVHAGEGNYAALSVNNSPEVYSNTVTAVPLTASLSIDKRWVGDTAGDRFTAPYGHVLLDSAGEGNHTQYVRAIAENFIVSTAGVTDIASYGGSWTMEDPVRLDTISLGTRKEWRVRWSKTASGGGKEYSPVTLYITTSNTTSNYADHNTGVTWNFRWEGLPVLENKTWSVKERKAFTYTSADHLRTVEYDTPVHYDADGQPVSEAQNGGSVTNIRIHDDKTRIAVNKEWRIQSPTGTNGTGAPDTYVEVSLVASYTEKESGVSHTLTGEQIDADPYFAAQGISGTILLLPEKNWNGAFDNLPMYYNGHLSQPISYSVREEKVLDDGQELTGFNSRTKKNAENDFTVINEKETIEKYVNGAVHAVLPQMDDVFTYDLMVYVPEGATEVSITDTLPAALEFVDWEGRTKYTYASDGASVTRTENPAFNDGNSLVRSARMNEETGSIDLWSVFDHDGSGAGHVVNIAKHEADSGSRKGTYALRTGSVTVTAADQNAEQTLTVSLDVTNDPGFFNAVNTYDARWVQVHFRARIRPEFYRQIAPRITETHTVWNDSTDTVLGWAIVKEDGNVNESQGEKTDGDGTVVHARMQDANGTYMTFGDAHAGEGNKASLKIGNSANAVWSNTVTVVPVTNEITIDKVWMKDTSAERPTIEAWKNSLVLYSKRTADDATLYSLNAGTMTQVYDGGGNPVANTWSKKELNSGVTVTLTVRENPLDASRWEAVWSGLPKLNDNYYTVEETAPAAYQVSYDNTDSTPGKNVSDAALANGDIRNEKREISIPLTKVWYDTPGKSKRPDSIRVIVTGKAGSGQPSGGEHVREWVFTIGPEGVNTGTAENPQYTYTWNDTQTFATIQGLPQYYYDSNTGTYHAYTYTVREDAVSGYLPTDESGNILTGSDVNKPLSATGDVKLYNTETTFLTLTKQWEDGENADGGRPASIGVILEGFAGTTPVYNTAKQETVVTPDASGNWTYTFTNLPKYHVEGGTKTEINYRVTENTATLPAGYIAVDNGVAYAAEDTVTGTLSAELTNRQVTQITLNKIWQATAAGSEVKIHLFGTTNVYNPPDPDPNSVIIKRYVPVYNANTGWSVKEAPNEDDAHEIKLNDGNSWTETISGLPKYIDGNRISWFAKEKSVTKNGTTMDLSGGRVTVDGTIYAVSPYTSGAQHISGDSATFTNREEVTLQITKTWANDNIETTPRPDQIKVVISAVAENPQDPATTVPVFTDRVYTLFVNRTGVTVYTEDPAARFYEATESDNVWTFAIPELKTHHTNGGKITYTVRETVPDGYAAAYAGGTANGIEKTPATENAPVAITNTRVEKVRVVAEKIWSPLPADATKRTVTVRLVATVDKGGAAEEVINSTTAEAQTKYRDLISAVESAVNGGWNKTITYTANVPMRAEWKDLPKTVTVGTDTFEVSYAVTETGALPAGYEKTEETVLISDGYQTTITNAKPAIEKYVNSERPVSQQAKANTNDGTGNITYGGDDEGVHTDLTAFNEPFTYDVQAYVTENAEIVVITDTLNEALTIVDAAGAPVPDGYLTDAVHIAAKESADENAPKLSGPAAIREGEEGLPAHAITKETVTAQDPVSRKNRQTLTVTVDLTEFATPAERALLRGKWLQITFNAKIKDSYLTPEALIGVSGDVLSNVDGYLTIDDPAHDVPVDTPMMNVLDIKTGNMTRRLVIYDTNPNTEDGHTGAVNRAGYRVEYTIDGSAGAYTKNSNIVTVDPPVESVAVTKEWVGAQIPALAPQGASATAEEADAAQAFLRRFVVGRTDGAGTDPNLWPNGLTAATAPAATDPVTEDYYVWSAPSWNSSEQAWIIVLNKYDKDTRQIVPAGTNDKPRSVALYLDPATALPAGKTTHVTDGGTPWLLVFSGLPVIDGVTYFVTENDAFTGFSAPYYDNTSSGAAAKTTDAAFTDGTIVNRQQTEIAVEKKWHWKDAGGVTQTIPPAQVQSVKVALIASYEDAAGVTHTVTGEDVADEIAKAETDRDTVIGQLIAETDGTAGNGKNLLEEKTLQAVTAPDPANDWKAAWKELPDVLVVNGAPRPVLYRVKETGVVLTGGTATVDAVTGQFAIGQEIFTATYDAANTAGLGTAHPATVITNTQEEKETVNVNAEKKWDPAPATGTEITLSLTASYTYTDTAVTPAATHTVTITSGAITDNGADITATATTAQKDIQTKLADRTLKEESDPADSWKAAWTNLPKYYIHGTALCEITYTVAEKAGAAGYSAVIGTPQTTVSGTVTSLSYTVENTLDETKLSLTKRWKDANQADAAPVIPVGVTTAAFITAFAENLALYSGTGAPDLTSDLLSAMTMSAPAPVAGSNAWNVSWTNGADTFTLTLSPDPESAQLENTVSWKLQFTGLPYVTNIVYAVKEKRAIDGYRLAVYGAAGTDSYAGEGGIITNRQYDEASVRANITKVWDDKDNLDGTRPENVTFHLYASTDGTAFTLVRVNGAGAPEITSLTETDYAALDNNGKAAYDLTVAKTDASATDSNQWETAVAGLPKYKNTAGIPTPYIYRLREMTDLTGQGYTTGKVPDDISIKDLGATDTTFDFEDVKNTHTPKTTDLTVEKTWIDGKGAAEDRTGQIIVRLVGKNPAGAEVQIPGVTHTEAGAEMTVTLSAAATGVTVDGSDKGKWSYTFTGLPVTYKEEKITYTIEEEEVTGYVSSVTQPVKQTDATGNVTYQAAAITNTLLTDIGVTKVWEDGGYTDRPGDAALANALTLCVYDSARPVDNTNPSPLANAGKPEITHVAGDADRRIATWKNLPLLTGTQSYVVRENNAAFAEKGYYAPVYTGANAFAKATSAKTDTITNRRYDDSVLGLQIQKNWVDDSNRDGKRRAPVFILSAQGEDGNWYLVNVEDSAAPAVTGNLLAAYDTMNTAQKSAYHITVTAQDANDPANNLAAWTAVNAVSNLPKYVFGTNTAYTYKLEEVNLPAGYSALVTVSGSSPSTNEANAGTVTGDLAYTAVNSYTPEKTSLKATKKWTGDTGQETQRTWITLTLDAHTEDGPVYNAASKPSEWTVEVPAAGKDPKDATLTEDDWTAEFADLNKYHNGKAVTYTITELSAIADYHTAYAPANRAITPSVTGSTDTFTVTNTYTPGTVSVSVQKAWDALANPPLGTQVTVSLQASYEDGGTLKQIDLTNVMDSVFGSSSPYDVSDRTLMEGNGFAASWDTLPEKYSGKTIQYTVKESAVRAAGSEITYYEGTAGQNTGTGGDFAYTITNSKKTTSLSVTKKWTGDTVSDRPDAETFVNALTLLQWKNGARVTGGADYVAGKDPHVSLTLVAGSTDTYTGIWNSTYGVTVSVTQGTGNTWTVAWNNLPWPDNTTFTVQETPLGAYGYHAPVYPAGQTDAKDGDTITNTAETTDITLTKNWNHTDGTESNAAANYPQEITVRLKGSDPDGNDIAGTGYTYRIGPNLTDDPAANPRTLRATLNTITGSWENITISGLPKYHQGRVITWTLTEDNVPRYVAGSASVAVPDAGGSYAAAFTNNYRAPETVKIRMIKNWEISDDLLANGALSTGVVLTARIADTTGSEPSYDTKADVDAADQDRKLTVFRTDSAKNGYDKTNKDHILATPEGDNWKFTITDLPKTDKQNREITYIIADLSKYNGSASTLDSSAIIRVMDPSGTSVRANETVSIEGTQKWTASMMGVSAQEAAGYAEKITVKVSAWKDSATKEFEKTYTVLAPGVAPASASEIASTASGDDWKFKITGLHKYTEAGDPLSYAVEETIVRESATAGTFRLSAFTLKEGTDAITYEASYEYQVPLTLLSASVAGGTSSGTEWNAAASGTSFKARFAAPHAALSGVKLNGTGLTSGTDYTAESGSTIITLLRESSTVQQELQKALDENGGSCVLTAVFTTTTGDREAEAKFKVTDTNPVLSKTGTSNALSSVTENTENATGAATGSTESSTENNTGNNTENNTGNGTESNTGSSTENNAGNSTESNTGSSTENNTGSSTESNTGNSKESNTGNSTGGSTENNAGGGTENNTVTPGTTNGTNTGTEGNGTEQNSGTETGAGVLGRVQVDRVSIKGVKTWKDNGNESKRPAYIELEVVGVREDNGQVEAHFVHRVDKPLATSDPTTGDALPNNTTAIPESRANESYTKDGYTTWEFFIDYYPYNETDPAKRTYLPRTTSDGVRVIYTVSEKTLSDNRYKKTDETLSFDKAVENYTFGVDYTYAVTDEYVPLEASGAFTATVNKSVAKVTIPEEIRYRITGTANGKTVYDEYYYIYTTEYPGPNMVTDNTTNGNRKPDIDIKVNSLTNEGKDWGFLIKDLPKFDPADDASPITYDVEEIPINGQSSQIVKKPLLRDLAAGSDTYELSQNSVDRVVSNLTEVTLFGTKTWDHGSNTTYPDKITLQVTGYNAAGAEVTKATVLDGAGPGTKTVSVGGTYTIARGSGTSPGVTVTSARNTAWSFRIDNLPMYEDEAAQTGPIRYVVKEIDDPADKYSITNETAANAVHTAGLSSGAYAVTNTYERPLNIEVTKTWEGDTASDRPAEVVFTLYANGTKVTDGGKDKTVTLTAAGGWKGSFTNLPATDAFGNAITYSVKEEELPNGYEYVSDAATTDNVKTVSGSSVTFKNTKTSPVEVSVEKHWFDAGGKSVNPPDEITSVTVQLTSNGVVSGSAVTLNSANSWKHTWENLPLADAEGNAISYSVTETQVLDKDGKNRINEYKQELTGTKVGTTHKHILNNTAKPPEEEKVKKTVNGTSDYTMKGTADALVYSIKSTVPDNATKFVMSDKMPGVMTTTAAQAFVAGTEQKTDMIIAIEDSLVTLTIDNAEAYRGKEIELRITAKIKEGADLTPYSNRQIPNTASVSVNGEAYATSEPATVTPEVLSRSRSINSNGTSNGRSGRNARTGDNDLMTRQLMMVGVIGTGLALATAGGVVRHRRKKREDDE